MKEKKNNITELVFIIDRSGSMFKLVNDTMGGFNSMIEKQKKQDGECYVSTVLFNDSTKVLHDRVKLENVSEMTGSDYTVGGCTALIDAIGGAILHIGNIHKYAREEDIPAHPRAGPARRIPERRLRHCKPLHSGRCQLL